MSCIHYGRRARRGVPTPPGTPIPTREPERTRLPDPDEGTGLNDGAGTRRQRDAEKADASRKQECDKAREKVSTFVHFCLLLSTSARQ